MRAASPNGAESASNPPVLHPRMPGRARPPYDDSHARSAYQSSLRHLLFLSSLILLVPASALLYKVAMGLFHKLRKAKHEQREHNHEDNVNVLEEENEEGEDKRVKNTQVGGVQSPTLRFNKGTTITIEMSPYMKPGDEVRPEIKSMIKGLSEKYLILMIFHVLTDEQEKKIQLQFRDLAYRCLFYETDCISIVRQFQPTVHFDQDNDRTRELTRLGLNVITLPFDSVVFK